MSRNPLKPLAWKPLFGRIDHEGYCLRMLRGRTPSLLRLDPDLHSYTLAVAVSLSGCTRMVTPKMEFELQNEQMVVFHAQSSLQWTLLGGVRLLLLEITREALDRMGRGSSLRDNLADFLTGMDPLQRPPENASLAILNLAQQLDQPPAHLACLDVWYQAKVLELAALTLFSTSSNDAASPERSHNHHPVVERAMFLIQRDLENPPSLAMLASATGCDAFQLSRLFARHCGRSIPEFLRQRRMERAASMLAGSRQSISEVALEVGYTSFSAFSRAFVREFGVSPKDYRSKKRGQ